MDKKFSNRVFSLFETIDNKMAENNERKKRIDEDFQKHKQEMEKRMAELDALFRK